MWTRVHSSFEIIIINSHNLVATFFSSSSLWFLLSHILIALHRTHTFNGTLCFLLLPFMQIHTISELKKKIANVKEDQKNHFSTLLLGRKIVKVMVRFTFLPYIYCNTIFCVCLCLSVWMSHAQRWQIVKGKEMDMRTKQIEHIEIREREREREKIETIVAEHRWKCE